MIVYLQGRWVGEEEARVSILDRGFTYGDGAFETLRAHGGRFLHEAEHWKRFQSTLAVLRLVCPETPERLVELGREALQRNGVRDAVVRVQVTRGRGTRGYSPRGAVDPTLAITCFPAPPHAAPRPGPWKLRTVLPRILSSELTAGLKVSSKIVQVLARAEAEAAGADEALLLNEFGRVTETSSANLFWWEEAGLRTPALSEGALAGITRAWLLREAKNHGWEVAECRIRPDELLDRATGVFITLSTWGWIEIGELDGIPLKRDRRLEQIALWHQKSIADLVSG